jgi:hypothetical protein
MTQLIVQGLDGSHIVLAGLGALPQSSSRATAAGGVQHGGRVVPGWGTVRPCKVTLGGLRGAPEPDALPDGPFLLRWLDDQSLERLDVADCLEADAAATVAAYLGECAITWDQIADLIRLADTPS